ncbi:hypothetical protein [Salipiger sp. PrR002]|uniref:hypothetical protein n=1 Tax=Salipiger sp. PrR002 TaxID=2706489 RepID=UPI0013B906EB|nr:hypothetical protein [Salipiger sp. PrR002]NDW00060.1 hypothetical protein [Salipiger sp. PrR002]NDW56931.1 hypothetical protein [Salipiger sp. PrR004]
MAVWIAPPWWLGDEAHAYADTALEAERASISRVLGPDGCPLPYEARPTLGFDLRPQERRHG